MEIGRIRVACIGVAVLTACGGAARAPVGSPGGDVGVQATREAAGGAVERSRTGHTEADVRFMQHMIHHHAQALEMTRLVPERTDREQIHLLARRIEVSQRDEIAQMQQWLRARGEGVPSPDPHLGHEAGADHPAMAGMLTHAQLQQLAAARGAEFERLFVQFMIHHHEGALTMVADLFASPGAGQESELYQFAAEVDTDQRLEIDRMRRVLSTIQPSPDR